MRRLLRQLRQLLPDMAWTISSDKKLDTPVMHISVNGVSTAFDTNGVDVTDKIR